MSERKAKASSYVRYAEGWEPTFFAVITLNGKMNMVSRKLAQHLRDELSSLLSQNTKTRKGAQSS